MSSDTSGGATAPDLTPASVEQSTVFPYLTADQYFLSAQDNDATFIHALEYSQSFTNDIDPALEAQAELLLPASSDVTLSTELVMAELQNFLIYVYQRYPLWHPVDFVERVNRGELDASTTFRLSCYAMIIFNEAGRFRKSPSRGPRRLTELRKLLQSQRTILVAQQPLCETAIHSLAIFIAHSVCDEHKMAFYYLTEAAELLCMIDPETLHPAEQARYWRVAAVLYVTESASSAVYGDPPTKGAIPHPQRLDDDENLMDWHVEDEYIQDGWIQPDHLKDGYHDLDKKATTFLRALVSLYGAVTTDQIVKISVPKSTICAIIEGTIPRSDTSVQEADVNLTQQWLLGQRWEDRLAASSAAQQPRGNAQAAYLLQSIGFTGLQHIRALDLGHRRIVGHGKLANLGTSIFSVASTLNVLAQCTHVISEIIRAVHDLDHERYFAPALSMIQIMIEGIPQQLRLPFNDEGGTQWQAVGSTWMDSREQNASSDC